MGPKALLCVNSPNSIKGIPPITHHWAETEEKKKSISTHAISKPSRVIKLLSLSFFLALSVCLSVCLCLSMRVHLQFLTSKPRLARGTKAFFLFLF